MSDKEAPTLTPVLQSQLAGVLVGLKSFRESDETPETGEKSNLPNVATNGTPSQTPEPQPVSAEVLAPKFYMAQSVYEVIGRILATNSNLQPGATSVQPRTALFQSGVSYVHSELPYVQPLVVFSHQNRGKWRKNRGNWNGNAGHGYYAGTGYGSNGEGYGSGGRGYGGGSRGYGGNGEGYGSGRRGYNDGGKGYGGGSRGYDGNGEGYGGGGRGYGGDGYARDNDGHVCSGCHQGEAWGHGGCGGYHHFY